MNGGLPRAILFDLDDTIVAYEAVMDDVWRSVCATFTPRIDGLEAEALLNAIQGYRRWFWSDPGRHRTGRLDPDVARHDLVPGALHRLGVLAPALADEIAEAYSSQRDDAMRLLPGAIETLRRLRDAGVRLALVTNGNGQHQRRKIDKFALASLFDHILVEGEFGVGKPDERVYSHALDQLSTQPEDAWMVGDNLEWDVAGPQRLGISGIWVDSSKKGLPRSSAVSPHRIIAALPELI